MSTALRDLKIVIVGAGFGGIAAAIELQRHGFADITILDAAPSLGGTWFHNTYPGAACDVPSHLYSLSYAQRGDWQRLCSPQPEILDYLRRVAHDHGVANHVVADSEIVACTWEEAPGRWAVATRDGRRYAADAIVLATGQLNLPAYPDIAGLERFAGHAFHSARWDHDYPLAGRRVAVIGTGASAVQFVPEIVRRTAHLVLFQRSANWFMPRRNPPYPHAVKALLGRVPGVQALRRRLTFNYEELLTAAIRHPRTVGRLVGLRSRAFMRSQLRDGDVRRKAWPAYTFGCKRVLFSSRFLTTLQRDDVELVTEAIVAIEPAGVRTADGALHEADCLIYATGFRTTDLLSGIRITGRGGRLLHEDWAEGAHAHLGLTVPGYPSMFVMYGPNTNTSGGSILVYLEAQAAYVRQALELVASRGAPIEVRPEVEAASDRAVQARFSGTAWLRCDSWYRDAGGRVVANWPGYMREYVHRTRVFDPDEYTFVPTPPRNVES